MKTPNYKDTESKHPIPHAKGIAKEETRENQKPKVNSQKIKASKEEE